MKVHNMMIQARDVQLNSAHATVDPTLVVCIHAHCSIAYMGCLLNRRRQLFAWVIVNSALQVVQVSCFLFVVVVVVVTL